MTITEKDLKKELDDFQAKTYWEILTEENSDEDEGNIRQEDF